MHTTQAHGAKHIHILPALNVSKRANMPETEDTDVLKYRVSHGSHAPIPPREQLCNRYCSNNHTHTDGSSICGRCCACACSMYGVCVRVRVGEKKGIGKGRRKEGEQTRRPCMPACVVGWRACVRACMRACVRARHQCVHVSRTHTPSA